MSRVFRVGDLVESLADPGRWVIVRLLRADRNYVRRAVIRSDDGTEAIRPVDVLRRPR